MLIALKGQLRNVYSDTDLIPIFWREPGASRAAQNPCFPNCEDRKECEELCRFQCRSKWRVGHTHLRKRKLRLFSGWTIKGRSPKRSRVWRFETGLRFTMVTHFPMERIGRLLSTTWLDCRFFVRDRWRNCPGRHRSLRSGH